MFIVTLYCNDRDETIEESGFDTIKEARAYAVALAKKLRINMSITISDPY